MNRVLIESLGGLGERVLGGLLGQAPRKTPRVMPQESPLPGPGGDQAHIASAPLGGPGTAASAPASLHPLGRVPDTGMLLQKTKQEQKPAARRACCAGTQHPPPLSQQLGGPHVTSASIGRQHLVRAQDNCRAAVSGACWTGLE